MLTAAGLVPAVTIAVLALPVTVLQGAVLLVVVGAAGEWSRLWGIAPKWVFAGFAGGSLAVVFGVGAPLGEYFAWIGVAWWLAAFVVVVRSRARMPPGAPAAPTGMLCGWLVLVPAGAAFAAVHARPGGPALAMTLLAIVWAADTGAWGVGRRLGRTLLAPRVSPGKTWEGFVGGVVAGGMTGAGAAWWLGLSVPGFTLVAMSVAAASAVGDLYESVCKRRAGVKDSGRLLPGHGGLLDRIDGLVAAAPVYAVATA